MSTKELMELLVEAAIPLETIHWAENLHPDPYLSPELKLNITEVLIKIREKVREYNVRQRTGSTPDSSFGNC